MKSSAQLVVILFLVFANSQLHAQTWTPYNIGTIDDVYAISFPTTDTGYVVTSAPELRKSVNGAVSWTAVTTPSPVSNVCFITGQKGFIAVDSTIYMTVNGGATWTDVLHDNVNYIHMQFVNQTVGYLTASNIYTSFDSTRLYKTVNGGASWTHVNTVLNYVYENALYFVSPSEGFLAHNNGMSTTTNAGASFSNVWSDPTFSNSPTQMTFPNVDTGYAMDMYGLAIRSVNGGASWSVITNPGAAPYDLYFINGQRGFVCGGDGFSSGWVQETVDGGATWTPSYTSPLTFGFMDFPNDNVGFVGGQGGVVLKFTNIITGVEQKENERVISVFPNPSGDGRVTIEFGNEVCKKVEVYNNVGQVIQADMIPLSTNNQIAIEGLTPGIYSFRMFFDNEKSEVKQVVIL